MKVLITGSKGFTGQYVAAALRAAGHEVEGVGLQPPRAGERGYHQADLSERDSLSRVLHEVAPAAVIHLAALAFVGELDPEAFYRINLIGTRNLLVAAEQYGRLECLVLASSGNVYGEQAIARIDESVCPQPVNEYAVSKLAMEHMARTWAGRLPLVITRPFNYTGLGQSERFLIPKIVDHFRRRERRIELGNLGVERDFCDVRCVAHAYRRLVECKPVGETINICSGRLTPLQELVEHCASLTGHSMQVEVNPQFVRNNEIVSLGGDPARLQAAIGAWEVPPIRDTLRWMLGSESDEAA